MRVMHTDEAGPPDRRTRRSEPHSGSRRDGSPRDRAAVEIQVVTAGDSLISEIVTLADSASQTLGFLPPPVFEEAARDQTLLAALHGRELAGYALFDLPKHHVRLVQLCVAPKFRGRGIARRLVATISERHHDRLGIQVRCRLDYPAHHLWPRLGFQPGAERRGRGREPSTLVVWWRDHGHPDLFSTVETSALRVTMDLNVFADLHTAQARSGGGESHALTQDWLSDQLQLVTTPELFREIGRLDNKNERQRQRQAAGVYHRPRIDAGRVEKLAAALIAHVREHQGVDLSVDDADRSDVYHVAETAISGVPVFATRDDRLIKRLSEAALEVCGVRVLHPADVVVRVDELARAQVYRPVELLDTQYTTNAVTAGAEQELLVFLDKPAGERRRGFAACLREAAAATPRWERMVIRDNRQRPVALYVVGPGDGELLVPLLRVQPSFRLADTMARQLLLLLRHRCRQHGLNRIRITDPYLSRSVALAAADDGFFQRGEELLALVIDRRADAARISADLARVGRAIGIDLPTLQPAPPAGVAAALERALWPAKILDAQLPTFLIPIRPTWSSELFGVPRGLFPRPALLGISREHVYYRSPRPRVETAPARLLWYVSGQRGRHAGVAAVIGCSRLEEVVVDDPQTLYARFHHLGVWQSQQIRQAARGGRTLALRFFDTEVFPHQVPLRRLRELARRFDLPLVLQSPQQLPNELFAAIYEKGQTG
jgi:GNAT superfamily N-acetyltransferase